MKKQTITMTPEGGRYWRMRFTHYAILSVFFIPVFLILCIFLLNPFWFRDDLLVWFENKINEFSIARNKLLYKIYLGADPDVWHALKD